MAASSRNNDGNGINLQLVPRQDNEPSVICKLYGHSASDIVEVCGWSLMRPLKLWNISFTTKFQSMIDGRGNVAPVADELSRKCLTLRQMSDYIGSPDRVIKCPLKVHVVAKRKVDVISYNQKLLIIPLVVVADESGYCVLCSMNEGLATIYNGVEVGDILLISECYPQRPRITYHRGLFSDELFLNMELKVTFHSVRNNFKDPFSAYRAAEFSFPKALFVDSQSIALKLPSDLEKEFEAVDKTDTKLKLVNVGENIKNYYDVVGVINHVGRIERYQIQDDVTLDVVEDGKLKSAKSMRRFLLSRWVYLVDPQSSGKGFPVKLYVNNATWDDQKEIIPGTIVVLSNCITMSGPFSGKYCITSHFSEIYVHGNLEKYLMLHPPNYKDKVNRVMLTNNYVETVGRNDVEFSVGGTHQWKFLNGDAFKQYYFENKPSLLKDLKNKPMRRMESRRLFFEGELLKVTRVFNEHEFKLQQPLPKYYAEWARKDQYHLIENFKQYKEYAHSNWYAWRRQLPGYDRALLRLSRYREISKGIIETYRSFVGWLSMPPVYENVQDIMNLQAIDGLPYIVLDVVNVEEKIWYSLMWKIPPTEFDQKFTNAMDSRGKKLIGVLEVYCTEIDAPLEVNLIDYVISD